MGKQLVWIDVDKSAYHHLCRTEIGLLERERRNSQKKPQENITAVKTQSEGLAKKREFHPIDPIPTWYTCDR